MQLVSKHHHQDTRPRNREAAHKKVLVSTVNSCIFFLGLTIARKRKRKSFVTVGKIWLVIDGGRLKEDSRPRPERFNHQPSTASHEIDGVRKEKERLTAAWTSHTFGLTAHFTSLML